MDILLKELEELNKKLVELGMSQESIEETLKEFVKIRVLKLF